MLLISLQVESVWYSLINLWLALSCLKAIIQGSFRDTVTLRRLSRLLQGKAAKFLFGWISSAKISVVIFMENCIIFSIYFTIGPINIFSWNGLCNVAFATSFYYCKFDGQAICAKVDINDDGIRLSISTIFNLSQLLHSSLTVIGKL